MTHSDRDGSEPLRRELHTYLAADTVDLAPWERALLTTAAPAGLPLHESADRDADNVPSDRVRAYAEAATRWMSFPSQAEHVARAVMAVADREQAELRAKVERLRQAHKAWRETSRSVSATVAHHWRETKDALAKAEANLTALRIDLAHAERMASDNEDRAEKAEATLARVEALHHIEHPTASDEVWDTNPECSCGGPWPCQTRRALRGPEPTDAP